LTSLSPGLFRIAIEEREMDRREFLTGSGGLIALASTSAVAGGQSTLEKANVPAAMVVYRAPSGTISLLVESSKAAVVAGGDESHYGALMFHYRNEGRFKVITWSAHNLSYCSCFVDRKFGTGILHGLPSKHGRSRAVPQPAVAPLSPKTQSTGIRNAWMCLYLRAAEFV
jgi:hypothetical protein